MTVLVTADLHLNNLARDQYRHDFQKQLRKQVLAHHATTLMILGDLCDDKDHHPATLVNKVVDHIYELSQIVTVIITMGNHDYSALAETPFFAFLKRIKNVFWIGEPTQPNLTTIKGLPDTTASNLAGSLILPHSPDPKRDWKSITLKHYELIFAHNTFAGTVGDSGRILEGASTDIFDKNSNVISGDVHTPQNVGPVTYCGSPYRVDFGDSFSPRMLLITKARIIKSIPCTGPQKQLVETQNLTLPSDAQLDKAGLVRGDILKVRVELDIGQYAQWAEIKDNVLAWGTKYGFIIHIVQPMTKKQTTPTKIAKRQAPKSDIEIIRGFAKSRNVDEHTVKIGLELLGQV